MGGRLTTGWHGVGASVAGRSHRDRGEPCQDALVIHHLGDGRLLIAVADGAGSARDAATGSKAAVTAAADAVAAGFDLDEAFVCAAASLGDTPRDRATTLLVAVLDGACLTVARVGDGHVVARFASGEYRSLAAIAPSEYLNETTFLSSSDWPDHFVVENSDGVTALAVMTDGLQYIAVDLVTGDPFPGFFDPLMAWAESAVGDDDHERERELASFLGSGRVGERTDDDVTLALAVHAG